MNLKYSACGVRLEQYLGSNKLCIQGKTFLNESDKY